MSRINNQFEPQSNLWQLGDLYAALNLTPAERQSLQENFELDISRVIVDSRQAVPGDLFVALPGDPGPKFNPSYRSDVDGHDFISQARHSGAVAAMVRRDSQVLLARQTGSQTSGTQLPLLPVDDTYDGLWTIGAAARQRLQGAAVAITGSSGKTTAKQFLSHALQAFSPPGSFNNHLGVPLALANTPPQSRYAVYEIGTNHPGEIAPLAQLVKPDVAVLLNVHTAHIENFPSQGALREEKASIFAALDRRENAISLDTLSLGFGHTFGAEVDADARILSLNGAQLELDLFGKKVQAFVPGGGMHRAQTLAATILTTHILGADIQAACNLPDSLIPVGRGNLQVFGGVTLIDESYNANPQSMLAALASALQHGRDNGHGTNIAVVGEMLELGSDSVAAHASLLDTLREFDRVFCIGLATRELATQLDAPWSAEANESLCSDVVSAAGASGCIVVKGSNRVFWARQFVPQLSGALDNLLV